MKQINTIIFLICICHQPILQAENLKRYYIKTASTPDILQTSVTNGGSYCGPAAASNSLVWLASNGYGRLLPEKPSQQKAQETLITLLAQSDYMNASDGTGVWGITRGLKKYIESKSYKVLKLFYQGWRSAPPEINTEKQLPNIEIIKDSVIGNTIVLLNIGWYKIKNERFERVGGHWITCVGYDRSDLLIYDPSPRAGKHKKLHKVSLRMIDRGNLSGDRKGLPVQAQGYYLLGGRV